jgi:hypothetical protein
MKRALVYALICGVSVAFTAGCSEESKTTSKETIKTPGGTTTITDEHKVDSSGKNPPKTP